MTVDLDMAIKSAVADIVAATPRILRLDDVDPQRGPVRMDLAPASTPHARTPGAMLAVAAAAVVLGVGAVALIGSRRAEIGSSSQPLSPELIPAVALPAEAPTPGSVVPTITDPPGELGELLPGQRDGGSRSGYWTAMSIGQVHGSEIRHPITIMIFDGTWDSLDGASTVTLDGRDYRRATIGTLEILADQSDRGGATIAASGATDLALLRVVVDSVIADTEQRPYAATVGLPAGYTVVAPLRELAADPTPRPTLVAMNGTLVINEVSDWVDPLTYATSTGADLQQQAAGDTTAWFGTVTSPTHGELTFLVWAPQPHVVFEIVSNDPTPTPELFTTVAEAVAVNTD